MELFYNKYDVFFSKKLTVANGFADIWNNLFKLSIIIQFNTEIIDDKNNYEVEKVFFNHRAKPSFR